MGWRYEWYTCGALVLVMSILRVTVVHLRETPKFLLAQGRDEEVVQGFQWLAEKYGRECGLTVEALRECGIVRSKVEMENKGLTGYFSRFREELTVHLKGLFATKVIGLSTALNWYLSSRPSRLILTKVTNLLGYPGRLSGLLILSTTSFSQSTFNLVGPRQETAAISQHGETTPLLISAVYSGLSSLASCVTGACWGEKARWSLALF